MGADTEAALPNMHSRSPGSQAAGSPCTCRSCSSCRTPPKKTCPCGACDCSTCTSACHYNSGVKVRTKKRLRCMSTHSFVGVPCIPENTESMMRGVSEIGQQKCTGLVFERLVRHSPMPLPCLRTPAAVSTRQRFRSAPLKSAWNTSRKQA